MAARRAVAFGDAAVLADGLARPEVHDVAESVRRAARAGVREVVEGLRSLLVTLDPDAFPVADAQAWVGEIETAPQSAMAPRTVVVPARFGGPDTDEVCRAAGIGPRELAELLTGAELTVGAVGFSPGFAYLEGLPPPLDGVARRARPRPVVPAGSVALAGGLAAVYPQATPGGWQLVGHSPLAMFDPSTPPYALLAPGDRVRFADDGPADRAPLTADGGGVTRTVGPPARSPLRAPNGRRPALRVEAGGVLSLVQDGGRRGVAHLGVPTAGPADPVAHVLANRLVGNPPDAAAVEVTAAGPTLRALGDVFVAVVGGAPAVLVDGREVGHGHLVPVSRGQELAVGTVREGLRSYLAVAGGLEVPEVLGSRSTDVLTWLGPGPLGPGDELGAGAARPESMRDHLVPGHLPVPATADRAWELRVLPGPHAGWMTGRDELTARTFTVAATSDRVGTRLEPDGDPVGRRAGELTSQGMVAGAVQLPPDGAPIVLGPDHATLGGYPVVAVVIRADAWMLGRCRPGDRIAFAPVNVADAVSARERLGHRMARAVAGRYPYPGVRP